MELASQECCLHCIFHSCTIDVFHRYVRIKEFIIILFTCRYVTFVLVIITFVFTLYSVVVLEKNRTRMAIFKSILEQLRKIFDRTT